ncbi:hypothetical protein [Streptomyces griseocarneus]|uniref:hypothetical protein n=1 Tax=Streptomyces griseocarneus TaxID=51201 RepID=UPI00167E85D3|nr:hypothetical protein [Streptomyces griseocarneus]MBZ6476746.1 hypothetical protein [Streptomyces griseocarneus]GHG80687.1 hypothetical protein GCM10018779_62460 [Streptomyces griseocarneus]
MSTNSRRTAALLRDRARTNRAKSRARRAASTAARRVRTGPRSLATHIIATGAPLDVVAGAADALRTQARKAGIRGRAVRIRRTLKGRARRVVTAYRYTVEQVAQIVANYKPRKAEYKAIRAALSAA